MSFKELDHEDSEQEPTQDKKLHLEQVQQQAGIFSTLIDRMVEEGHLTMQQIAESLPREAAQVLWLLSQPGWTLEVNWNGEVSLHERDSWEVSIRPEVSETLKVLAAIQQDKSIPTRKGFGNYEVWKLAPKGTALLQSYQEAHPDHLLGPDPLYLRARALSQKVDRQLDGIEQPPGGIGALEDWGAKGYGAALEMLSQTIPAFSYDVKWDQTRTDAERIIQDTMQSIRARLEEETTYFQAFQTQTEETLRELAALLQEGDSE